MAKASKKRMRFKKVYADKGYQGEVFADYVRQEFYGAEVQIGENRTNIREGFVPDKKRWIIERTFAWLFDCRRLIVDHERRIVHSFGMIRMASIRMMLRRLSPNPSTTW